MQFKHVVCGGTFDHFHLGHEKLLEACFNGGEKVTIGITSMAMVRPKPYSYSIEKYEDRSTSVANFAHLHNKSISSTQIEDIYGPTLKDNSIDAIYVTQDTLNGAKTINEKRVQIGMKPLSVITVPFVFADDGEKISSERIRSGVIDRNGLNYYKYLISKDTRILPETLRGVLREPLGRVISSFNDDLHLKEKEGADSAKNGGYTYTILVGDVITYNHLKQGKIPTISIIDGKTCRKALKTDYLDSIIVKGCSIAPNKMGTIQKEAVDALYQLIQLGHHKATSQLRIEGEEDLLTLVAVLLSPLGSHVWYGQQGVGAIDVLVTEKKKEIVYNLVRQFT